MQEMLTAEPFQTMDEVDQYLSGNTITCLICGVELQRLNRHVQKEHELSLDEYRTKFGIPYSRSLTSAASREKTGSRMTPERIEKFIRDNAGRYAVPGRAAHKNGRVPAVANQWKKISERGRNFARRLVITKCAGCGCDISTTALGATQPIRCLKCATPGAFKARVKYWKQKRIA